MNLHFFSLTRGFGINITGLLGVFIMHAFMRNCPESQKVMATSCVCCLCWQSEEDRQITSFSQKATFKHTHNKLIMFNSQKKLLFWSCLYKLLIWLWPCYRAHSDYEFFFLNVSGKAHMIYKQHILSLFFKVSFFIALSKGNKIHLPPSLKLKTHHIICSLFNPGTGTKKPKNKNSPFSNYCFSAAASQSLSRNSVHWCFVWSTNLALNNFCWNYFLHEDIWVNQSFKDNGECLKYIFYIYCAIY